MRTLRRARSLLAGLALALAAFLAPARETAADAQAPPSRFDPAAAHVVDGTPLAAARAALARGDVTVARDVATAALATAHGDDAFPLRFVQGRALVASGDLAGGAAAFAVVAARSGHPLARWAVLLHAETIESTDPAAALTEARTVVEGWPGSSRARAVVGRALAATGAVDDALPILRALVAASPGRSGAAAGARPRADARAARAGAAAQGGARTRYPRVATRAPLSDAGRTASTRADAVLAALPADRRTALARLPVDDALVRAQALLDAQRYADAEAAMREVVARPDASAAQVCEARRGAALSLVRHHARAQGANELVALAADCADADVRAAALYDAGKARAGADPSGAVAAFDTLAHDLPSHRLADDALVRGALASRDAANVDGFRQRLHTLLDALPDGDVRPDAHFLLAWQSRADGDHAGALAELDRAIADHVVDTAEDTRGRARYWRGRELEALARTADAKDDYAALARDLPLSYYAQASLARLATLDAARAAALRANWSATTEPPLAFAHRAEMDAPGFARAVALLRVLEVDLATQELSALGLLGEGADPDALWLVAALYDRAGAFPASVALSRRRLASFRAVLPVGSARALWRVAYPRAYAGAVEDAASAEHVPASLLRALAREESGFDPAARSGAGAIGLVQLLPGTAHRFGAQIAVPSDDASLGRPEIALRIGARFVAMLLARYPTRTALVPAAYNAGEGALDRFLHAHSADDLPAFIEDIPYEETRRYTRRVVQSWGVYSALDGGDPPTL